MLILEGNENKAKLKILRLYLSKCTTPCKVTNLHIDIKPTLFFCCQYHLK